MRIINRFVLIHDFLFDVCYLDGNEMTGTVPDSIGSVKSLEYLIFGEWCISNVSFVTFYFHLNSNNLVLFCHGFPTADNLLTGTIPSTIADLQNMKYISLCKWNEKYRANIYVPHTILTTFSRRYWNAIQPTIHSPEQSQVNWVDS